MDAQLAVEALNPTQCVTDWPTVRSPFETSTGNYTMTALSPRGLVDLLRQRPLPHDALLRSVEKVKVMVTIPAKMRVLLGSRLWGCVQRASDMRVQSAITGDCKIRFDVAHSYGIASLELLQ